MFFVRFSGFRVIVVVVVVVVVVVGPSRHFENLAPGRGRLFWKCAFGAITRP